VKEFDDFSETVSFSHCFSSLVYLTENGYS
jgi:hypothetical protein